MSELTDAIDIVDGAVQRLKQMTPRGWDVVNTLELGVSQLKSLASRVVIPPPPANEFPPVLLDSVDGRIKLGDVKVLETHPFTLRVDGSLPMHWGAVGIGGPCACPWNPDTGEFKFTAFAAGLCYVIVQVTNQFGTAVATVEFNVLP